MTILGSTQNCHWAPFDLLNLGLYRIFSAVAFGRFARWFVPGWTFFFFFFFPKRKRNQSKSRSNPAPARVFCSRARKKTRFAGQRLGHGSAPFAANHPTGFSLRPATKSRAVGIFSKAGWAVRISYSSIFDFRRHQWYFLSCISIFYIH